MFAHVGACFSRFRHIQDPGITGSNNAKQNLLFKSGYSIKNHWSNLFGIFFHFCFKGKHSSFFLRDSISVITITIIIACHLLYHATHASTLPTSPTVARKALHFSNSDIRPPVKFNYFYANLSLKFVLSINLKT